MIDFEELKHIKKGLEEEYQERHDALRKLRAYYHGRYWELADQKTDTLTTIFRDLVGDRNDLGPDIKVVNNLLFTIVTKYQSFLSSTPMIRVYVDPPGNQRQYAQATTRERYLYGTWGDGQMNSKLAQLGWYLPLFGHAFLGAFPDLERNKVTPILRSPEYAFPVPNFDGSQLDGVIFCWEARESAVKRAFPSYVPTQPKPGRFFRRKPRPSDPKVKIYEYSGLNEWCRYVEDQLVNGVEHNFGFNLFEQAKFIEVPGEVWGHGAVEQVVNQVELGNALESLLFQAVIDNVFPTLVLENPSKAPEEIERGPGSVIPINEGGKAYYLNGNVNMQQGVGMLQENERQIKQNTSMPDVSLGSFRASIVTGKAVNELQGAGTGSTVEMVQSNLGPALVGFNERAIVMAQTMFREETIYLQGGRPSTYADINPRFFTFKAKGKEIVGSPRNEVVFQPHMDLQTKVVVGLQMAGAGLVSKQWQREQAGIPDSAAMDDEILREAVQDAVFGFVLSSLDPNNPDATVAAGQAYVEGLPSRQPPAAAPPLPPTAELGAPVGAQPTPAPPAPAGAEAPPLPGAGAGVPIASPEAASGASVTVEQAASAIQAVGPVPGRVFLIGEIVDRGETDDEVEVAVTDRAAITMIRPNVQFPTDFTLVPDTPAERYIEVTPGTDITEGGEEPDLEALGQA